MSLEVKTVLEIGGAIVAIMLAIIAKAKNWFPFKGEIIVSEKGGGMTKLSDTPVTFGDLQRHCDRQQENYKQTIVSEISEWKGEVTQRLITGDKQFEALGEKMDGVQTTLASLTTAVGILTKEVKKNNGGCR
jgi:hypothetical protein